MFFQHLCIAFSGNNNMQQKSSAGQNNSVTLSSVIIAIIVLYSFVIEHYKDTTIFANRQIYR